MTRILQFFPVILIFAVSALTAQTKPPMQQGVNVQMAVTESAQPMPAADEANAWVVTIDRSGTVFFRANRTDVAELTSWMQAHPRDRGANLYIKADAGVGFGVVRKVLHAGREAGFDAPVLLTSQSAASQGGLIPPVGEAVQLAPAATKDVPSIDVFKTNHPDPMLKINNQPIPSAAFVSTLSQVLKAQKQETVLLKADDRLLYAQVVHVIDQCHSAGAKVALVNLE
jgi:biopolymer transport protein ExbD